MTKTKNVQSVKKKFKSLNKKKKIHFIGIGGIGMSALARYFLKIGYQVSGSDLSENEITRELEKEGIKIFYPHLARNIKNDLERVIFTLAIDKNNPELKRAQELKIPCQSYSEALGELTKKYYTIAVCGTHGKSTTTALTALTLIKAGFSPTVILGTKLREFHNSNFHYGKKNFLVIEADEHFASFLNYWPKIIILTNMEGDHFDFFKNKKNYIRAFKKFVSRLPPDGFLIANKDDPDVYRTFLKEKRVKFYSLKDKKAKEIQKRIFLPGSFNVSNALAVFLLSKILKIKEKNFFSVIEKYQGAWRRMQKKIVFYKKKKFTLFHDYGHHPTEVEKTIFALKEKYKKNRIFFIFQPHQIFRTEYFLKDFQKVFQRSPVEKGVIVNVYYVAGREKKGQEKIDLSEKLVKKINRDNFLYLPRVEQAIEYFFPQLKKDDILLCMGAGDIYDRVEKFFDNDKIKAKKNGKSLS